MLNFDLKSVNLRQCKNNDGKKLKQRDITEKTIKRLYALSENQCAFSDCNISLLSSGSEINFPIFAILKQQNQVDKDII